MKKIFTSIAILVCSVVSLSAQVNSKPAAPSKYMQRSFSNDYQRPNISCSANTALLLLELDKLKKQGLTLDDSATEIIQRFNLRKPNGQYSIGGFLMVTPSFDEAQFAAVGGVISTRANNIYTITLPVTSIQELASVAGITYLQAAERGDVAMDVVRQVTGVNMIHQGTQLPQAYQGEGVIVGIIDIGFDYTHPNFYSDLTMSNYRVKKVWEQIATSGTPPQGFDYGRELTTQSQILAALGDRPDASHGTHVAGIAAGSVPLYTGVAPKSDLVFVSTSMTDEGIADGIEYIKTYAQSQNKPCVINMSISNEIGPHDGNSMMDIFYDNMVEDGLILVAAAGNQGQNPLHVTKTLGSTPGTLFTAIKFPNNPADYAGEAIIDIWGDAGMDYDVAINVYNFTTNTYEDWTPYYLASNSVVADGYLEDNDSQTNDHTVYELASTYSPSNNKYNTRIYMPQTTMTTSVTYY
jgi:minor extracellular serine protease Vpr